MHVKREEGDPLHSAREGKEELAQRKREMGSYAWAGQYQQRPAPKDGGLIKGSWFKRYKKFKRLIISLDTAYKAEQHNDPSVFTVWGETDTAYYLLEVICKRYEYPELIRAFLNTADKWNPDVVLIEDKASGQSLIQDLRRETTLPVIAIKPLHDKLTRLITCSPIIEAGNVYLPERAP